MGEDEMEDFEEGEEESYYENEEGVESDQEEVPALVPIQNKPKKAVSFQAPELSESSEKSEEPQSESDSFDSQEEEDEDAERAHGFIYSHHLDTYKKSKKEKNVD